jgi:hypothetical protein
MYSLSFKDVNVTTVLGFNYSQDKNRGIFLF